MILSQRPGAYLRSFVLLSVQCNKNGKINLLVMFQKCNRVAHVALLRMSNLINVFFMFWCRSIGVIGAQ